MSVNEKMTAIADAIREKTGGTEKLTLDGMATAISGIEIGGGYDEGFADGKQAEYDAFWDTFQDYGNRTSYSYAFAGSSWTKENFKPKYDLIPGKNGVSYMFYNAFVRESEPVDLVEILDNLDIVLDVSGSINNSPSMFENSNIWHVGVIDASNRNSAVLSSCFRGSKVKRIELIKLSSAGSQSFSQTFNIAAGASGIHPLEYVRFEGCIGQNLSMALCANLTYESLLSIISCLMDLTGTTTTRTLTLHADAKARLTEADIATITQKGWTLA